MNNSAAYKGYVRSGAQYCEDLFKTAEKFFRANTAVEEVIAQDSELTKDSIEYIAGIFAECCALAQRTTQSLDVFSNIHNNYSDQSVFINFSEQQDRLTSLHENTSRISHLVLQLTPGEDLQEQIWADDEYTEKFVDSARLVCALVEWQCSSAESTHEN